MTTTPWAWIPPILPAHLPLHPTHPSNEQLQRDGFPTKRGCRAFLGCAGALLETHSKWTSRLIGESGSFLDLKAHTPGTSAHCFTFNMCTNDYAVPQCVFELVTLFRLLEDIFYYWGGQISIFHILVCFLFNSYCVPWFVNSIDNSKCLPINTPRKPIDFGISQSVRACMNFFFQMTFAPKCFNEPTQQPPTEEKLCLYKNGK